MNFKQTPPSVLLEKKGERDWGHPPEYKSFGGVENYTLLWLTEIQRNTSEHLKKRDLCGFPELSNTQTFLANNTFLSQGLKRCLNNYMLLSKRRNTEKIAPLVKFKFLTSCNKRW